MLETLEEALEREGVGWVAEEVATVLMEEGDWCACWRPPPLPGETRFV